MAKLQAGIVVGFAFFLGACQTPVFKKQELSTALVESELRKQEVALLEYQLKQFKRLRNVSYPIYRDSVPMCGEKIIRSVGFSADTPSGYDEKSRQAAIEAYGLGDLPVIVLVVKGSPAERAGLKTGDIITSFDGIPVATGDSAAESLQKNIKGFAKTKSEVFDITIRRDKKEMAFSVRPDVVCDYPIRYNPEDSRNAHADGAKVVIYAGMMRFVENDDELAAIIGHELAHNTMRHMDKKKTNQAVGIAAGVVLDVLAALAGVNTQGGFTKTAGNIGAQAYSQDFESEADYVGLYYVARAGFNIDAAAPLWRRMGASRSDVNELKIATTHPTTAERFLRLEKTAAEIKAKIATGATLIPEFDKAAPWLKSAPDESETKDDSPTS